jgi:uncharacterized protein
VNIQIMKKNMSRIATILSIVSLLIASSSILLLYTNQINVSKESILVKQIPQNEQPLKIINSSIVSLYVPAVDSEGNGVPTKLTVQVIPGNGKILTNINNLLFWVDTQQSIQVAQAVAKNITKADISKVDIIYSIETNATIIEGPSAGAALTIATIAALENKPINTSVMITGTINPDGTIGPVGGILAKAKAAKDVGATLFLVPEGQGVQTTYVPKQQCEKIGPITFCTTEYIKQTVDTKKSIGIQVIEVSNIHEALKYFLIA